MTLLKGKVHIVLIAGKKNIVVEVITGNRDFARYLIKHGFRSRTSLCSNPEELHEDMPCRYERRFTHDFEARYLVKQLELKAAELGLNVTTRIVKSVSVNEE